MSVGGVLERGCGPPQAPPRSAIFDLQSGEMMNPIEHWTHDPAAQAACASFGDGSEIVETAIAIQQIPAPTFHETRRGRYVEQQMLALGLADVDIDAVGNVYGRRAGKA